MSVTRGIPSRMLTSRGLDPCYICMILLPSKLFKEEVIQVVNLLPLVTTLSAPTKFLFYTKPIFLCSFVVWASKKPSLKLLFYLASSTALLMS